MPVVFILLQEFNKFPVSHSLLCDDRSDCSHHSSCWHTPPLLQTDSPQKGMAAWSSGISLCHCIRRWGRILPWLAPPELQLLAIHVYTQHRCRTHMAERKNVTLLTGEQTHKNLHHASKSERVWNYERRYEWWSYIPPTDSLVFLGHPMSYTSRIQLCCKGKGSKSCQHDELHVIWQWLVMRLMYAVRW